MSVALDSPDQVLESVVVMRLRGHFEATSARAASLTRPVLVLSRFLTSITAPKPSVSAPSCPLSPLPLLRECSCFSQRHGVSGPSLHFPDTLDMTL